ncbi:MAG: protein TolR [Gammaproteobacteria bacterium RIFOXYA12_FULL_61_12]|nr:MAG: protein TolR [Gammaproteobacteria bacterium RIFOXYD12_FULL_61_37]OGT93854.1 MAG: protein TolR [Gammaproteobacteria bacterium RIFOXYA12_FULL_61_12]
MARSRHSRKPMSQINVVPYIDVMLVLLVIFMVTAPMVSQGIKVDLPQLDSEPLPPDQEEPLIVSVDKAGLMYVNIGDDKDKPVEAEALQLRVAAVLRNAPKTPVLVKGDKDVDYGKVVGAMQLLQKAGAPNVGLMTETPEG